MQPQDILCSAVFFIFCAMRRWKVQRRHWALSKFESLIRISEGPDGRLQGIWSIAESIVMLPCIDLLAIDPHANPIVVTDGESVRSCFGRSNLAHRISRDIGGLGTDIGAFAPTKVPCEIAPTALLNSLEWAMKMWWPHYHPCRYQSQRYVCWANRRRIFQPIQTD